MIGLSMPQVELQNVWSELQKVQQTLTAEKSNSNMLKQKLDAAEADVAAITSKLEAAEAGVVAAKVYIPGLQLCVTNAVSSCCTSRSV